MEHQGQSGSNDRSSGTDSLPNFSPMTATAGNVPPTVILPRGCASRLLTIEACALYLTKSPQDETALTWIAEIKRQAAKTPALPGSMITLTARFDTDDRKVVATEIAALAQEWSKKYQAQMAAMLAGSDS